jgi:hypothetical protein
MNNFCTIYSHNLCYEDLLSLLKSHFPDSQIEEKKSEDGTNIIVSSGGLFNKNHFQISYRQRASPSFEIRKIDSPLTENLSGMSKFISQIVTLNEHTKSLLIQKIQTINSEIPILTPGRPSKELEHFIEKFTKEQDGLVFANPNTTIAKSEAQHFLNKNLELILDMNGLSGVNELEININSELFDSKIVGTDEQSNRKENSEQKIHSIGVKINTNLPVTNNLEETFIRSEHEIAERATILAVTNLVAFNHMSGEEAFDYLDKYGLRHLLTTKEIDFLEDPNETKRNHETWKCECIWVLLWALNIQDQLGSPNEMADLNKIPTEKYPLGIDKDPKDFIIDGHIVRSKEQILEAQDFYYRLDWACVDARLKGEQLQNVNSGVVYERHYALNWLVNYRGQDWDEVSCDT